MTFKKLFLPVGLIVAVGFALLFPQHGSYCKTELKLIPWLVAVIFFLNGYTTDLKSFKFTKPFALSFLAMVLVSLVLGPFLGLGIGLLYGFTGAFALGLLVMASVPPTLSSCVVLTDIAKGNTIWALLMNIGLNFLGILSIPLMLKICLSIDGDIKLSPMKLLMKLVILVLVPFLCGMVVKHLLKHRKLATPLTYIPSTAVILTVWMSLADSKSDLLGVNVRELGLAIGGVLTVHLILMGMCFGVSKLLQLAKPERTTLLLVGSQKTLPVAITVLACIAPEASVALVVCLLFHFSQLILDSILASKWAGSEDVQAAEDTDGVLGNGEEPAVGTN